MTKDLKCEICGHENVSIPGLYYIDMFHNSNCPSCNQDMIICDNCHNVKMRGQGKHHFSKTTERFNICKSCIRDEKLEVILDDKL